MNKTRRTAITALAEDVRAIRDRIEDLQSEEQDAFDNLPENLQEGEKGEAMQESIEALDSACTAVDELDNYLTEALGE